jgi:molybdopterin molybdotransferase
MIALDEAQRRVAAACAPLGSETVALEAAAGRVLAERLGASADLVPFARSAMDGFAVRAADLRTSRELPVRERVYAGATAMLVHAAGTATEIATGAPIPNGADAVVRLEDVVRFNGTIRVNAHVEAGTNVFGPGEDARTGDPLLERGRRLTAADTGLLAAAGCARLGVFGRPRIAIVSTGDEVVDVAAVPAYGQIRNSNAVVVAATAAAWGGDVVLQTHAADDASALRAALDGALSACDLLITTGGASVGGRDLVKSLLRALDCAFAFDAIALRPAKPTAFATRGAVRIAVLPGNPSSAFVALHEIVRIATLGLAGCAGDNRLPRVRATLAGGRIHGKAERTYAAYATVRTAPSGFIATPLDNQCSALTRTASDAAGFIVVPPGRRDYSPGEAVDVDVVDWTRVG